VRAPWRGNDVRYGEGALAYRSDVSKSGSSRGRSKGWSLLDSVDLALTMRDARGDAVTTAALSVVRRALVEGVPVTREGFAQEASFALGGSTEDALRHVDDVAQRLGVSSLS
jgi:hypothetical protein